MWQIFFLSEMMSPFRKKNTGRELLACGASSAAVLRMFYSVTGNTCKMFFCQLTILTGKNCYTEFSIGIVAWLLLTFFLYLHNQLSSIHSIITCQKKVINQIDSKNGWLLFSAIFTAKFEMVLV